MILIVEGGGGMPLASHRLQQTEWRSESIQIAQSIAAYVAEGGTSSIAFALAWVIKHRLISAAISGPRTEAQWDSYVDALQLQLNVDDEQFIDRLAAPGHASTAGYTDPAYPVEGRPVC